MAERFVGIVCLIWVMFGLRACCDFCGGGLFVLFTLVDDVGLLLLLCGFVCVALCALVVYCLVVGTVVVVV